MNTIMNLKIRHLAIMVLVLIITSGGVFISTSLTTSKSMDHTLDVWDQYKADTNPKAVAYSAIVKNIGYGGMVHHFKNYVLRKDKPRIAKFQNAAGGVQAAIDQYKATGPSKEELEALDHISKTVGKYARKITAIRLLVRYKHKARKIDRSVKVNDASALAGLHKLHKFTRASKIAKHRDNLTKTDLIGNIRSAIGYGGMIHQFKNFVIRGDMQRIDKMQNAIKKIHDAIGVYRNKPLSDIEKKALQNIDHTVGKYAKAVGTARELSKQGKTPEQIDKAIKINDKPAIEGLKTLVIATGEEMKSQGEDLSNNLVSSRNMSLLALIIAGVTSAIMALFVYMVLFRQIISPLGCITKAMTDLTKGKLNIKLPEARANEIGELVEGLRVFRENALSKIEMEAKQVELAKQNEDDRHRRMHEIANDFDASVGCIVETVSSASTELNSTAQSMAGISEQTSRQATAASAVSQQTSSNVQSVATATEEMTSNIGEISQQVAQASSASQQAVEEVDSTSQQMGVLAKTANKIGEVVEIISSIAEQTNLLALNATIESARAGDAGRGFAVVAGEVKELASQTVKATDEISQQIGDIQAATNQASSSMENVSRTIRSVDEISSAIAAAMSEQSAATQEIAGNVYKAATGTQQVSDNIVSVTEASQEAGVVSGEVMSAAGELSQQAELLKGEVGKFIAHVRAG